MGLLLGGQYVAFNRGIVAGFNGLQPCLGVALLNQRYALAIDQQTAMRAGAQACIFAIAPIGQVVNAFRTRTGMVGNFIGG